MNVEPFASDKYQTMRAGCLGKDVLSIVKRAEPIGARTGLLVYLDVGILNPYLIHKVVIHSRALEKVMDRVLKVHNNHVTQEEYIFDEGHSQVVLVLSTIALFENVLYITPFERFEDLRRSIESFTTAAPGPAVEPIALPAPAPFDYANTFTSEETNPYAYFVDVALEREGSENNFFSAKDAMKVWKALKRPQVHKRVVSKIPKECDMVEQFIEIGSRRFPKGIRRPSQILSSLGCLRRSLGRRMIGTGLVLGRRICCSRRNPVWR